MNAGGVQSWLSLFPQSLQLLGLPHVLLPLQPPIAIIEENRGAIPEVNRESMKHSVQLFNKTRILLAEMSEISGFFWTNTVAPLFQFLPN